MRNGRRQRWFGCLIKEGKIGNAAFFRKGQFLNVPGTAKMSLVCCDETTSITFVKFCLFLFLGLGRHVVLLSAMCYRS